MIAVAFWLSPLGVLVWWLGTLAWIVVALYACRVGDRRRDDEERFRAAARRYCRTVEK